MVNDQISDSLIRIKNGYMAGLKIVQLANSKVVLALCQVLVKKSYLTEASADGYFINVGLKYANKAPVVTEMVRISKPSVRIYVDKNNIPVVLGGKGICVISTPKGLMTGQEAKKQNLGGEVLCKVW